MRGHCLSTLSGRAVGTRGHPYASSERATRVTGKHPGGPGGGRVGRLASAFGAATGILRPVSCPKFQSTCILCWLYRRRASHPRRDVVGRNRRHRRTFKEGLGLAKNDSDGHGTTNAAFCRRATCPRRPK